MEDKELNQFLKNALSTNFKPDYELNVRIVQKARGNNMIKTKRVKKLSTVAAVCCLILCCTVTAFAAWNFLTPKDIASEYGDKQLAKAFESKDAVLINESQTYGKYMVTLLGAVSGSDLSDFCSDNNQVSTAKTYAVVAISQNDGTPMPATSSNEYGKESFLISPFIQGLNPKDYNIFTMNGGYFEIVKNGIMYRMIECDNIELFADRDLYLGVSNTAFYNNEAYNFDEKTGKISPNSSYKEMNILFHLPLKSDKADKKAAELYLKKLALSQGNDVDKNKAAEDQSKEGVVDITEITEHWTLLSEKKVAPDKAGTIYYSYKTMQGGSGEGSITEDALFDEGQIGYSKNFNLIKEGDKDKVSKQVAVLFSRDKDGDVTVSVYETDK